MDFQDQLETIVLSEATKLVGYDKGIDFCQKELKKLKLEFIPGSNLGVQEEINFFKIIKQKAQSQLFYYWELRAYQANYPLSGNKAEKKYIQLKLKKAQTFLDSHTNFRNYLKLGHTHHDHLYFTRKGIQGVNTAMAIGSIVESDFYTSHDIILSRIKANESLVAFYETNLKDLRKRKSNQITSLQWASSKVAFVELVYALYHTGVFKHKDIPVSTIAKVLGECFQIPSFDIYNTYSDIKRRKKEPSAFLNQMLLSFHQALEKDIHSD